MAHLFANTHAPRILLVKTTSLGDVIHNLPVVSDIRRNYPGAMIDWIVEESFAALPKLHPGVRKVIPVAVRRWRRNLLAASTWRETASFRRALAGEHYDVAIDTQGLVKSALLMRSARALRCGFDRRSAREPLAAMFYQRTFPVATRQHAVERNRQLAAQALGYTIDQNADYGINPPPVARPDWLGDGAYAVLLHATSRADKLWAEQNWTTLGRYLVEKGMRCILPWGSKAEQVRASRLADTVPDAVIPPHLDLDEASALLGGARAVVGVDTGLSHLAAALGVPTIGIYTATDPTLTGLHAGRCSINLGNIARMPDTTSVIEALQELGAC